MGVLRSGITPVLGIYGVEYQHPGGQVSPSFWFLLAVGVFHSSCGLSVCLGWLLCSPSFFLAFRSVVFPSFRSFN